jgi:4-hydroxybutyrate dehydrogenase / sulfolactaldehyde 3-reductase
MNIRSKEAKADLSPTPKPGARVLFVGLGTMGLPMATNLVRKGFDVQGADHNRAAVAALAALGGRGVSDLAQAAQDVDVVVTMLPDDRVVMDVLQAPEGLISHTRAGALIIEMSTTAPSTKIELARQANERGIGFIESPVGKTAEHAVSGTLTLMVGGDPGLIERARSLLDAMGSDLHVCGDVGTGSSVKLINNTLVACVNAASIEALVAGRKANLDLAMLMGVFKTTMAWNNALALGLPRKALKRDFKPGFMTRLAHKDVGLALSMAKELHVPMTQGDAAYAILEEALARGFASDDSAGSMMRVCEANGDVELSLEAPR